MQAPHSSFSAWKALIRMIIDTLDQRHRYSGIPGLMEALEAIVGLGEDTEPGHRVELGESVGSVGVAEFTSLDPLVQTRFEAHREFVDVHAVLAGEELIQISSRHGLTVATEFDPTQDVGFHDGEPTVSVTLRPGWFVVCFPEDAHRPGIWIDGPARVLKAVGKMRAN